MNTSQLKTFAQKARNIIRDGVSRQLKYWGFDEKGNVECRPEKVEGGIVHREEIIDDPSVMKRWETLNHAVKHQGFDQVVEEAAYTWFNRMMAIRILSKNGYDVPQLEYGADGAQTPLILQRARRGQFAFLNKEEQTRLKLVLTDYSKDTQAFAILLTGYCHSHSLLNSIFGRLDDYTELLLPADMLNENGFIHFLNTTSAISDDDYRQVELIGWLYQFYISEKKDQVFAQFKKNQKAEAKDIPAATQIFTPNWIVKYMVENTVGKIWLDKHPGSPLKAGLKYLVESPDQPLGDPLISEISQLKLLDPAAGSGHILVEGFELLFQMYLEEYYMPEEAVESILKNNLFGLDIDLRAAQLARFAILMKAASKYPEILQKNILPKVYAMPAPWNFSRQEILDFLGSEGRPYEEKLSDALQLMQQAQNLGSVMKFDFFVDERSFIVARLENLKNKVFRDNLEEVLLQKIAPFIEVLVILTDRYESIAANPPYMGSGNMNGELKQYVNSNYPLSKTDLMTVFMEVTCDLIKDNGQVGMINLPSWMFLSSFEKMRQKFVESFLITSLIQQGRGIFGSDFGSVSFCFSRENPDGKKGVYRRLFKEHVKVDSVAEKEKRFLDKSYGLFIFKQSNFSKIPGSPIAYWVTEKVGDLFFQDKIKKYGISDGQNITGDNEKYIKFIWEVNGKKIGKGFKWVPVAKGGSFRRWYGNIIDLIDWSEEARNFYRKNTIARIQDKSLWFRPGVTWNLISSGGTGFRILEESVLFNKAAPTILFNENNIEKLNFVLGFLNTKLVKDLLKILNPTINTNIAEILVLPLIEKRLNLIEQKVKDCIYISQKDWNSREISLCFEETPLINQAQSLSQAFLKWQEGVRNVFFQLHFNEEELNQIFIDIYGLNNELDPIVPLKDITILQDELDEKGLEKTDKAIRKRRQWKLVEDKWLLSVDESKPLPELPIKRDVVMKQLVSYSIGCMMGRYRLDQPGLHIAHPNPTHEEVCTYDFNGHEFEIDDDGIIPLMGSNCTFADDAVNRFNHFLEIVWGAETLTQNKNFLVDCLNLKTENQEIEKYLVKDFWKDHCQTYKKKPIYWLFASAKGAFQVLVYMHRMNRFTAEKIRSKYLLKHLQYLLQEIGLLESMSGLAREEQKRLDTLHTHYDECVPYELLLKDCADRQIEFNMDDGVTVNYELFKGVVAPIK
ncbi:type II restriction enzyme methylase subunit [Aquipluma nitroreducens]|uniref:site-specific DNA-methyltransferase (adenine-specific) n=1 Tax=Aquipluma nitroreducens TaxID=2010828 RepID=A0A5K7SGT4_9BACT|nr:BREX-1 system adenine-specific DNA-methyltransferase PglX [Aquipluma nitroreducens]BBE20444.1 type II restriction enzyme methylase subunit [Aquipluma nitroreducens]